MEKYIGATGLQYLWGKIKAVIPTTMVASGSSHAGGLVPDPGSTEGTTKFLREDGTWQVPAGGGSATLPNNVSYWEADSGDGIVPEDGIRVETIASAATMSVNPDVLTIINGSVGTTTITLLVPNDNLAHVWDIVFTTGANPNITIAMSNSATILEPDGFDGVAASKAIEISVIGKGTIYYMRYGGFA